MNAIESTLVVGGSLVSYDKYCKQGASAAVRVKTYLSWKLKESARLVHCCVDRQGRQEGGYSNKTTSPGVLYLLEVPHFDPPVNFAHAVINMSYVKVQIEINLILMPLSGINLGASVCLKNGKA